MSGPPRPRGRLGGVAVVVVLASGCASPSPSEPATSGLVSVDSLAATPEMPFVAVAADGSGFALESGDAFVPWGFNYHNAGLGQLIEDYWDDEASWLVTADDF